MVSLEVLTVNYLSMQLFKTDQPSYYILYLNLGNYTKSRQLFQDKIITQLLDGALVQDTKNGVVCRMPTEPWIVFTAGAMVSSHGFLLFVNDLH
jgi:hypothetical protein